MLYNKYKIGGQMSDNNLININNMSNEQIMKAIGQDDGSSSRTNIPRLTINRTPEDDDGNQLPVGYFSTYDARIGQNVYGKPITLRPLISAIQYMHYDADKSEYVNRSIIFKSWEEEAIDILGGTRCGKVSYKDRSSLTPEQLERQRTIRCYKLVYGLLSFKNGKTAQGHAHNVENLPVLYRVTGLVELRVQQRTGHSPTAHHFMVYQVCSEVHIIRECILLILLDQKIRVK